MKKLCVNFKEKYANKETCVFLLLSILFGIVLYSILIENNLTNQYDGLWNGTHYLSSRPEVGAGRWMFFICDRLIFGYKGEPLVSCMSITIFAIGNLVLLNTLKINKKLEKYFISFTIISTTTVCCMLSYKHQSYIFALSYLFSVLAAYCLIEIENKYVSFLLSVILLIMSLGSYQSQIGCFCLVIVFYLIIEIANGKSLKDYIFIIIKTILIIIVSCILYKIICDIMIKLLNVSFSYKGFNSLSIIDMIKQLPISFIKTYKYFYDYFFGTFKINAYQNILFILIFVFIVCSFIVGFIKNKRIDLIMFLLLIPVCCNFSILFIDSDVMLQQTLATSITMPLLVVISYEILKMCTNNNVFVGIICFILSFVLLFGNVITTGTDIDSMRQGKTSVEYIVSSVCDDLIDKNMFDSNMKYFFVGTPCKNDMFNVNDLWNKSNDYAKYGDFWKNAYCLPISYQGIVNNIGINLKCNFPSNQEYNDFINGDFCKEMPCYPNEGYIKEENGCIFIKISNDYILDSDN